ncbi:transposase [Myxococcus sp. AM010]|uniref:transposase n=1 Tax=Myxococcus sp. AM010 TaxID=2745138 RepID=UPI0020D17706|nr:transposase [Myxococcus sp. AM010]
MRWCRKASSCRGRAACASRRCRRPRKDLHANDRQGLERRCRYGARGALALERLSRAEDGRIAYRMKRPLPDGTTHLLFTGLELLRRVASLVPPPRGKPHEIPRRLRSRRQTAAISGPSIRCAGGERGA